MSIQDHYAMVQDHLLIGRCPYDQDEVEAIKTQIGATAILSLQHDECLMRLNIDYARHEQHGQNIGLVMKRCPLIDHDLHHQQLELPRAVNTSQELLQAGHQVYVHCTLGINRAPTVVLAYLTVIEGMSVENAIRQIRKVRPYADPSWDALDAYHHAIFGNAPVYENLAGVSERH